MRKTNQMVTKDVFLLQRQSNPQFLCSNKGSNPKDSALIRTKVNAYFDRVTTVQACACIFAQTHICTIFLHMYSLENVDLWWGARDISDTEPERTYRVLRCVNAEADVNNTDFYGTKYRGLEAGGIFCTFYLGYEVEILALTWFPQHQSWKYGIFKFCAIHTCKSFKCDHT